MKFKGMVSVDYTNRRGEDGTLALMMNVPREATDKHNLIMEVLAKLTLQVRDEGGTDITQGNVEITEVE